MVHTVVISITQDNRTGKQKPACYTSVELLGNSISFGEVIASSAAEPWIKAFIKVQF